MCIKHAGLRLSFCICSVSSDVCSFRHSFFAERCTVAFRYQKLSRSSALMIDPRQLKKSANSPNCWNKRIFKLWFFVVLLSRWTSMIGCRNGEQKTGVARTLIVLMSDVWKTSTAWVGRIFHLFLSSLQWRKKIRFGGLWKEGWQHSWRKWPHFKHRGTHCLDAKATRRGNKAAKWKRHSGVRGVIDSGWMLECFFCGNSGIKNMPFFWVKKLL